MNRTLFVTCRLLAVISLLILGCSAPLKTAQSEPIVSRRELTILFYNVENLFDTTDDPDTQDEDFTPTGKNQWTEERLGEKYSRVAEVIKRSGKFPGIVGLCEIENRKVLEELIMHPELADAKYSIVHRDSPDRRGIDVALLHREDQFSVEASRWLRVSLSKPKDTETRDILYVRGTAGGETLHLFVNHWPSRGGGEEASAPFRADAAKVLRAAVDSVFRTDGQARIICMGDFNDYPTNASIREVLGADDNGERGLVNLMSVIHARGEGSYWYRGEWGALDQFFVSTSLVHGKGGWTISSTGASIVREPYLLFTDGKGEQRPNRSYAGDVYVGGYSDHLPVMLSLVR